MRGGGEPEHYLQTVFLLCVTTPPKPYATSEAEFYNVSPDARVIFFRRKKMEDCFKNSSALTKIAPSLILYVLHLLL